MNIKHLFYFILLASALNTLAQKPSDSLLLKRYEELSSSGTDIQKKFRITQNKSIVKPFFILYKKLFSEQFATKCTFTPTCSEFALTSVQKKGLIFGFLLALDRLTRCNGYVGKQCSHIHYNATNETYNDSIDLYK